jgi:ribA/ribD-fused uncharacterized protein
MTDYTHPIRFHDPRDPETGYLSNFHRAGFTLDGAAWPTVEHYYQAQKFAGSPPTDPSWHEAVRLAESPRLAKEMGRSTEHSIRPDWDTVKERVMLKALVAKFVQNPDLALRLFATRYRLVEASPEDAYWGEGPGKTGENRLGRLLMAIREELPEADHQNMLEYDDAGFLQALCEDAAWKVVCDLNFKHNTWYPRLSFNVLTSPFYGQSARQIAQKLQPLLGRPLAAVLPWRSDEDTEGRPEGWTLQWYADTSPDSETLHQGYTVRGAVTHRMAHWPLYSVALKNTPVARIEQSPTWIPFGHGIRESFWHTPWQFEAVWHLPGPDHDKLLDYHYPPVAEAIALELERRHRLTRHSEKRYLFVYTKPDEGFDPHADEGATLHGWPDASPYGTPWRLLACTEAHGALPKLQAEFTRLWEYWGIDLPIEDVVHRRAGSFEDTPLGDAGWILRYQFGHNERGEYVEIESDHRKCGPENYRLYADGGRETMPTYMDEALHQQAVDQGFVPSEQPELQLTPTPNEVPGSMGRIFQRLLGLVVIAIGLVPLFEVSGMEHIHYPMVVFALVMIVLGGLVIWQRNDHE